MYLNPIRSNLFFFKNFKKHLCFCANIISRNTCVGVHSGFADKCSRTFDIGVSSVLSNHNSVLGLHTSAVKCHGEYEWQDPKSDDEIVYVEVTDKEGKTHRVRGKVGDNLLYLSKRFEVEMEGACEASLACTTCHVYVDHDFLDVLPEATETEEDLLDQAPFLRENSRLGCQIILSKELDGLKLTLPAATKNFYVDGHKPTPH